jgi:hypothetical protein
MAKGIRGANASATFMLDHNELIETVLTTTPALFWIRTWLLSGRSSECR